MTTEIKARRKIVSLWLPAAVLFFGLIFLVFVAIEYQRNTALVEQNRALISNSAKVALTNSLMSRNTSKNWGSVKGRYDWIKNPPRTYWFNDGVQEFPWRRPLVTTASREGTNWKSTWADINSTSPSAYVNKQRLALLTAVQKALSTGDELAIQRSFDAYLDHKNAYHLSPQEEISFSLKLIEIGAQEHWSRELVHAILITGGSSDAPIFRPIVDLLFRHADLFSVDEFDLIIEKVIQQLEAFNLSGYYLDEYLRHLNSPNFSLSDNTIASDQDTSVVTDKGWLLHGTTKTLISAEPFVLSEELQFIESEFIEQGVLNPGDSLMLNDFVNSISVSSLGVKVHKTQLEVDKCNQAVYLIVKSIMLIAFIALILLTLRLIGKNQQRRLEYLALREDFVKLVSHELKTPLAGIRAMAETLRKRVERGLGVQSYPERIISEADKLWYMVDNILGFNRVQLTEVIIEQRPIKLKSTCNSIIDDVGTFSNKPYAVNNTINEAVEVSVDAELFALVVKNIVVNAGLYNENATIDIELVFDESEQCLLITDNGVGIADDDRSRIFQPFVRLTQSVRRSGTGLGLAICKRIMQLHNGDLSLAQSSDHGSVWKISLGH